MKRGKVVRVQDGSPVCPPKHTRTDAIALANKSTVGAEKIELYYAEIHPGGEGEEDSHPDVEHGFFILSGVAEASVEDQAFELTANEFLFVPEGAVHAIRPKGGESIKFIVFFAPQRT